MGDDEGFKFGRPQAETDGVLVCWMVTREAIAAAAAEGHNLIITHEALHFPYTFRDPELHKYLAWRVNHARLSELAKRDISVYRAHGQLDRFCILDDFGRALHLPEAEVREGYYRVYSIDPVSVGDLAGRVKEHLELGRVRVSGRLDRIVGRVGLPWGGLGLSVNVTFINGLLQYDPDVLIAGECDEYAFRFACDADVAMIETGHSVSENPGLARFAEVLGGQFPALPIQYYEVPCPWQTV